MTESNVPLNGSEGDGRASGNSPWGVILLAHGSQRGTSPQECSCAWGANGAETPPAWCRHCPSTPQGLGEAAQRLQAELQSDQALVLLSCLEFIQPHPDQAVQLLADRGLQQVVVMPYLLGQGKHATLELDEVLDEIRAQVPQVQIILTEALGADPRLADLVLQRIGNLNGAAPASNDGETTGILLVKAGTRTQYDDCLWLEELGQMVESRLGLGYAVAVAQSHYGDPTMDTAGTKLVEERGVSSIICVPYIFFPGMILKRNVLGGMAALQEKYPHVTMTVAPPLGVDDRVVAVAADRIRAAWQWATVGT
ncbi:MAG: sirohydrochlorin chelatase [Dehalococcoidia bacterium]